MSLYGGFAGTETERAQRDLAANPTVLDGSVANNGTPAASVVVGVSNVTLDGFTIKGGRGEQGAGMSTDGTESPITGLTVSNCIFEDNAAVSYGGAMYNGANVAITITSCAFNGNSAAVSGGAMLNQASTPIIEACTFTDNEAANGGAVFNLDGALPTFTNCTFTGNQATQTGGALTNLETEPALTGCVFQANNAVTAGGRDLQLQRISPDNRV